MASCAPKAPAAGGRLRQAPLGRVLRIALWIARRYLLGHGYATFINWISFTGLALGVMILTVVLSVMNGFDREITGRVLSAVPHAVVTPKRDAIGEPPALCRVAGVARCDRFFQGEAMLASAVAVNFLTLAAFDRAGVAGAPTLVPDAARARLFDTPGGIVLGERLALAAGLDVGHPVALVLAVPEHGGVRSVVARFSLVGTFATGANPDAGLGVVLREDLVRRGLLAAGVDGWRVTLDDPFAAPALATTLRSALGAASEVRFWMEDYGELFRAVKIEKAMMFALLALIVAIAAFNIVSGQAMLVNDKRRDVAMLATLGASRSFLVAVFFLQGFSVAFLGVAAGLGTGVLVATHADAVVTLLEGVIGASIIDGTWFQRVPSLVLGSDLAGIAALSLGLSAVAVTWPALKATQEDPADALHAV